MRLKVIAKNCYQIDKDVEQLIPYLVGVISYVNETLFRVAFSGMGEYLGNAVNHVR